MKLELKSPGLRCGWLSLLLGATLALGAGSPYLSSVGPPPLRFQAPFDSAKPTNRVDAILGPLAVSVPDPEPSSSSSATNIVQTPAPPDPLAASGDPVPPPDAVMNPVQPLTPEPPHFSPEDVLRLIVPVGTNSTVGAIVPVVGFTPPLPPVVRPSTATYSTSP
jgi:hypothetical protein